MAGKLGKVHVPFEHLVETLSKLTVPELQQELKKRGLKKSGVKIKLIHRLKEAIESEEAGEELHNVSQSTDEQSGPADYGAFDESINTKESTELHDPYTEFESSIPGVVDTNEVKSKEADDAVVQDVSSKVGQTESVPVEGEAAVGQQNIAIEHSVGNVLGAQRSEESTSEVQHLEGQVSEDQRPIYHSSPSAHETVESFEDEMNQENENDSELQGYQDEANVKSDEQERNSQFVPDYEASSEEKEQKTEEIDQFEQGGDKMHKEMVDHENAGDEKMEVNEMSTEKEAVEACDDHDGIGIDVDKGDKDELIVHEEDNDKFIEQDKKEEKKKQIAPVQLKKRRIFTEDSTSKQDIPVPRKRRWGSSTKKESLTISSESLKGLIPDVSVIPNEDPLGLALDYGEMEEGEIDEVVEAEPMPDDESDSKDMREGDEVVEGNIKKEVRKGRIVRISMKDTVKLQTTESKEENEMITESEKEKETSMEITIPEERVSLLPQVSTEDPEFVRERSPSPAKNKTSNILSIRNLVRPFTLRQLREFLSRSGTVIEDGFWIDRIKSHCYVTYETVDDAIATRTAIHGTRWPTGNPKVLSADFAINDEMYIETEGKLGKPPSPIKAEEAKPQKENDATWQRRREKSPEKEKRGIAREKSRDKENKAIDHESAKPKEKKETAGKLLDDLFRKTKSLPCIYWLPLTNEQVAAKEQELEKRRDELRKVNEEANDRENKEREERKKQRESEAVRRERERGSPKDIRDNRQMPAQYRNKRRSSLSP